MPETIFQTPLQLVITCLVLMIAQVVYVTFGFGSGLISVGCLALVFPEIRDVVVVLLLVNLPAELAVVLNSRSEIRWRPIATLGIGILVGVPVGTRILSASDPRMVLMILGWFLVAVGLLFLRLPTGRRHQPPTVAAPPVGFLSGLLTGMFGTGGPPLIVWYHLSAASKAAFRGNLMTIFLLKTFVRVPAYVHDGLVTAPRLWSTLVCLPAVLLGAWIGHRLHIKISEATFRRLVSGLLVVLGVVLLIRK